MKRIVSILLIVILSMSTLLTGCKKSDNAGSENGGSSSGSSSSDVIKIGVFEPMTGADGAGGSLELEGIKLANELYPEVLGKKVELVVVDNKSDKTEASNAVSRLIEKEKVTAIIGSWGSGYSMAAGPIALKAKVPVIGASCTNPNVTKGNDYYFRVCFIDPFQGTVMANYAFNKLNARKAVVIQEVSNDYSVGLGSFFMDSFKKLTGDENSILSEPLNYNQGDQDFTAQLTSVKSLNPDVIFAPGNFTSSALLIKQAKQLGINVPIIGGDTWETDEFIKIGGEAVEGSVFSTFFAKEVMVSEESKKYMAEYEKRYPGKEPAAVGVLGYDAYLVVLDAIKKANSTDPVKIRDEIAKTKDFPGAAGVISLDQNGDAIKDAIIKTVKDGQFKYLDTVKAN